MYLSKKSAVSSVQKTNQSKNKMNIEKILRIAAIFVWLLVLDTSCNPIKDNRIRRLMREATPPSGEPNFNAPVPLPSDAKTKLCSDVCVPLHLCVEGVVMTSGANLFLPRIGMDGVECSESETCCLLKDEDDEDDYATDDDELGLGSDSDSKSTQKAESREPRKCGQRNINKLELRITVDDTTSFGEFPWMVMIMKRTPKSEVYDYQCGGSLIHPSVVLTAAHCVHGKQANVLHIRAGEWNMENTDETLPHQDRPIKAIVIHRKYDTSTFVNDIALLFLENPVELADNVNTVCLPPPNTGFESVSNERCEVSGWGKKRRSRVSRYQTILKKVELPVIPHNQCEMLFRKTVLGKYFRLHRSFLCAGGEHGKDACKGDGGSPLVCKISNTDDSYYQSGIVSWGIGCSAENIP